MAINSKSSQGKNTMYIRPRADRKDSTKATTNPDGSIRTKSGTSTIVANVKKQNSNDSVNITAGDDFYQAFKNESIENLLIEKGFSQFRPEILGSFEFIPPLSDFNIEQDASDVLFNCSASGELIDMSSQLKHLRYDFMAHFLESKLGITKDMLLDLQLPGLEDPYETPLPSDTLELSRENRNKLFESWVDNLLTYNNSMSSLVAGAPEGNVSAILDFLSAALTIYDLEEAMQIKVNAYNGVSNMMGDNSGLIMDKYSDTFVFNKAPGNISFQGYCQDVLNCPEPYWNKVSNTALVAQLFTDAVVRTVHHPRDFTSSGTKYFNEDELGPGYFPGHTLTPFSPAAPNQNDDSRLIRKLAQIDYKKIGGEIYDDQPHLGEADLSGEFMNQNDFNKLWQRIVVSKDPSYLNYIFRDFMTFARDMSNDYRGASNASSVSDASTMGVNDFLGWDPFTPQRNIANWTPPENIQHIRGAYGWEGVLFKDEDTGDIIAPFNFGGDTPGGSGFTPIPGKEFFLDSFWENGSVASTLEKLSRWTDQLTSTSEALEEFVSKSIYSHSDPTASRSSDRTNPFANDQAFGEISRMDVGDLIGINGSDGAAVAATPLQIVFQDLGSWLSSKYLQPVKNGAAADMKYTEMSSLLTMMMCTEDPGAAWQGFALAAARDRVKNPYRQGTESMMNKMKNLGDAATKLGAYLTQQVGFMGGLAEGGTVAREEMTSGDIMYFGHGYAEDAHPISETNDVFDASHIVGDMDDVYGVSSYGESQGFISSDFNGSWYPLIDAHNVSRFVHYLNEDIIFEYAQTNMAYREAYNSVYQNLNSTGQSSYSNVMLGGQMDNDTHSSAYSFGTSASAINSISGGETSNIFDICYAAVDKWEALVKDGIPERYREDIGSTDTGSSFGYTATGLDRDSRALACYMFLITLLQQTQKLALYSPNDYNNGHTYMFSLSKRACESYVYAAENIRDEHISESLAGTDYDKYDHLPWGIRPGFPSRTAVIEIQNLFKRYYATQLEWDVMAFNSTFFYKEIVRELKAKIEEIISTFNLLGEHSSTVDEMFDKIPTTTDLKDMILSATTKEQVALSRYLELVLAGRSSKYPFLPASKVVIPEQAKLVAALSRAPGLLTTETSGKKRIFSIGLPLGLIDFLRRAASRELSNPKYNESNIIKISLWRRNLLNELEEHLPQEFVFDMSRFVIDGAAFIADPPPGHVHSRPTNVVSDQPSETLNPTHAVVIGPGVIAGTGDEDSSAFRSRNLSLDEVLDIFSLSKISHMGLVRTIRGKGYDSGIIDSFEGFDNDQADNLIDVMGNASISEDHKNVFKQIYNNHILDWYYKTYLKLTSGIDLGEDNFCLAPDNEVMMIPDGVYPDPEFAGDPEKKEIYSFLKQISASLFSDRDIADSINFERLLGEISRSFLCSPEKYLRRTVFPKIFDRIFCILVDEADWGTESPADIDRENTYNIDGLENYEDAAPGSYSFSMSNPADPTYHQYYVTVSIMTEIDDATVGSGLIL